MTLKEIQQQIDAAHAAPINTDGTSEFFDLPRVYYKDLPVKLKGEVNRIELEAVKRFLLECYPVGTLDDVLADQTAFKEKLVKALHTARYLIESTDLTPPQLTGNEKADAAILEAFKPVSLIGADFIEAWEKVTGVKATITTEEAKAALPRLTSIVLQKHLIPNNKLANSLTSLTTEIIQHAFNLKVGGKGENEIKTRCILSYEGESVKLSSRQPFTEYDRTVADAVTSLYEYGDASHIITPATVYRAMVHATETETPSPQQIGAVTRSLDKMRFVRVQIDCTEELKKRKLSLDGAQRTGGKIDTYLLTLKALEVEAGGQKVKAYKVIDAPVLYEYSRLIGQVITVPAALLDVRDSTGAKVANTERRIAIKSYLLRRISVMKGKTSNRQSKHIMYDAIYDTVGDRKELSRKDQKAIRDYISLVLESWKREGFIKGFSDLTEGRKKTGVTITL